MVPRQPESMERIELKGKVEYVSQLKHRYLQYSTKPFWQDLSYLSHMPRGTRHHYSMYTSNTEDECGCQNWPSMFPSKYVH
jgi:hypothetical protein